MAGSGEIYQDLKIIMDSNIPAVYGPEDSRMQGVYRDALTHFFMPKQTPGELQPNLEIIEEFLLHQFCDSVQDTLEELPFPQLESALVMLNKWKCVQPESSNCSLFINAFPEEISALTKGNMIPIYVRNQNSAMLLKKSDDDTIVLSTFRCSLPSGVVMSTVGDLFMVFPETRETIQNSGMLASKAFAKQLHDLAVGNVDIALKKTSKGKSEFKEVRDVADPKFVSDWIVGLLAPASTDASEKLELHQFRKKFGDHVTLEGKGGSASLLPFRRSGMYMAIKAALQMKLLENLGSKEESRLVYKIIVLRVLADVANEFDVTNSFDMDLACQMMAKLGRRVKKLTNLPDPASSSAVAEEISLLKTKSLERVMCTVMKMSGRMKEVWDHVTNKNTGVPGEEQSLAPKQGDLLHEIPQLDRFVEKLKTSFCSAPTGCSNSIPCESQIFGRYNSSWSILNAVNALSSDNAFVWLHDTEKFIKYNCNSEYTEASVISQLVTVYVSNAKMYYQNDPLGKSQIFLVVLKGLQIIDMITLQLYPLLEEYKPEVNMELFDHLLLPFEKDMILLDDMLDYFKTRHQRTTLSEILSTNIVTADTFSVRFAKQNLKMQMLRMKILADTKADIQKKCKELNETVLKCNEMELKIIELISDCKCEWKIRQVRDYRNRDKLVDEQYKVECSSCKLQKWESEKLDLLRKSVSRYERPLPPQEDYQWGLIFELLIPQQFAIFRDFLAYFKFEIFGENFEGEQNHNKIFWLEYSEISRYQGTSGSKFIHLGSSALPSSRTNHTKTPLDVLNNKPEEYVINNGMGCTFYYTGTKSATVSMKTACSFKLNTTSKCHPYLNLQDTLLSTEHTPNSAVARKNECHLDLSLDEFVAFGSLRAGHRVQLRNLYEAIFSGSLSFEQEPVLALILQTIWQVGPRNETGERESHLDFSQEQQFEFAEEFLEMLDKLVKTNQANYSNSLILLVAILIVRRIGELNYMLKAKCYTLLKTWRGIMHNWTTKIQSVIDQPETASVYGGIPSLRKNLLEIVTCSMCSYSIHDTLNISEVLREQDDVIHWFHTIYLRHQFQEQPVPTSDFFKIIQNFVKALPLRMELEKQIIAGSPFFVNSLNGFISKRWNKTGDCTLNSVESPYKTSSKESLILVEYLETGMATGEQITHRITFDLIRGAFLVNGFSQSSLPSEVKRHKLFQMYFKDGTNLRIQRDNEKVSRTVTPFQGKHYEFYQNCFKSFSFLRDQDKDEDLIIKEIQETSTPTRTLVLLNPHKLSFQLSFYFIENFTHWLDTANDKVYLRPINGDQSNHPYYYSMSKRWLASTSTPRGVWTLFDERSGQFVLSIHTGGFQRITKKLDRLEMSEYINVTTPDQENLTTATLRRYNLRFTLNEPDDELESVEYPGYRVSINQTSLGTLVGIRQGLLLENGEKRLIIMPHATIRVIIEDQNLHQCVAISLETLRQPACFVYEFDDVLKRLKAHNNKSAWLYLAALHAVTSSALPDPFTEVTGTEMAVRILQSACVWSCAPYDVESMTTFNFIKTLSPNRKWYGHSSSGKTFSHGDKGSMENTAWPEGLPTMAAYDGFALIVDKLIADSKKLAVLHKTTTSDKQTDGFNKSEEILGSERLRMRAYLRWLPMYNPMVAVEYPNYFGRSKVALLNGEMDIPEHQFSLRSSSKEWDISSLQLMSFAALPGSIQPLKARDVFRKNTLTKFLITDQPLSPPKLPSTVSLHKSGGFQDVLHLESGFRSNWLSLYSMALNCQIQEDFSHLGIILSALALRGAVPMEQVANLLCIAVSQANALTDTKNQILFPDACSFLSSGSPTCYSTPTSNVYVTSTVVDILASHSKPFTALQLPILPTKLESYGWHHLSMEDYQFLQQQYENKMAKYKRDLEEFRVQKAAYDAEIKASCREISSYCERLYWPCEKIELEAIGHVLESRHFESRPVVCKLNPTLACWYRNYKLKRFVDYVQENLNNIWDKLEEGEFAERNAASCPSPHQLKKQVTLVSAKKVVRKSVQIEDGVITTKFLEWAIADANIFKSGQFQTHYGVNNNTTTTDFVHQRDICLLWIKQLNDDILGMTTGNISKQILYETGVAPRLDPQSILKTLTRDSKEQDGIFVEFAGSLGVLWTHLKRLNRCVRASNDAELQREIANPGHENWSPKDHPEWLLLELELDIMIRPVQVKVARQMINMPNAGNGVTQLNMGEGKTSVIVPMLCASLAEKKSQLCRVTVLSSMFRMNLTSLTFSIGGLLNRRVYSVPCRRDMEIDPQCVNQIIATYQECLEIGGVVLTLPEHRLSFRLLAYDKMFKKDSSLGQKMLQVENFLREFARDILDESDELFSVKYQLVYTMGKQVPIDGGELRWTTCQKILHIVRKVAGDMMTSYGTEQIEFDKNVQEARPHEFSTFRLLGGGNCLDTFLDLVADSVLSEIRVSSSEKSIVKKFLLHNEIGMYEHLQVISSIFKDFPDVLNKILLVSGYLKRGILKLALTKRWRVEYGVSPNPAFPRLMAIPFRAKDVAAEKTEFGHPDLAIILTHLSYYYSGLDAKQLEQVFDILKGKQAPDAIYSQWISKIPQELVPDFLGRYCSLNMKDAYQKSQLFKMLKKHKMVVDFWLSHFVFPRECKQFPGKLVMTAWDLCYERQRLPVSGFSGTNDSQVLLPLMISQQDLVELQSTNVKMEGTLLLPENCNHKGFKMGVTCQEILETMKQDKLTVLIDAGALMLECSNEQLADLWLEVDQQIEAAVYFSENNELLVKSRGDHGSGVPFEVSPYQGRLDKCGVFLDDQHTRGTDLKFPLGSKACVTIATRMRRDKLIQACMRMRKLGQGHTVTFYLSHEAHDKVSGVSAVTTQAVLNWVCQNTKESNEDGLLYWALAGMNYAQRLAAEDHFHYPHYEKPYVVDLNNDALALIATVLARQCVDDEVTKLMDMYGQFTQLELLTQLIPQWFQSAKRKLQAKTGDRQVSQTIIQNFDAICDSVTRKCLEHVPTKKNISSNSGMMEEEQEKELELEKEVEVEEERQVQRPPRATPAIHHLHEKVKSFAVNGGTIRPDGECFFKLSHIFENVTFWKDVQPECWQGNVFVTNDFATTIETGTEYMRTYNKTDLYLRPMQYMISCHHPSSGAVQLLILSPFEVNKLLPYFRRRQTKCQLHMFSMRRTEKQDLLLNNPRLQLPASALHTSYKVPEDGPETASLLLASASLYFNSMEEQKAFARFLGLVPQPWSQAESKADELGLITKSGFLLPQYRSSLEYQTGFDEDPTTLVKKILKGRFPNVSEITHVMRLLSTQCYVEVE